MRLTGESDLAHFSLSGLGLMKLPNYDIFKTQFPSRNFILIKLIIFLFEGKVQVND